MRLASPQAIDIKWLPDQAKTWRLRTNKKSITQIHCIFKCLRCCALSAIAGTGKNGAVTSSSWDTVGSRTAEDSMVSGSALVPVPSDLLEIRTTGQPHRGDQKDHAPLGESESRQAPRRDRSPYARRPGAPAQTPAATASPCAALVCYFGVIVENDVMYDEQPAGNDQCHLTSAARQHSSARAPQRRESRSWSTDSVRHRHRRRGAS